MKTMGKNILLSLAAVIIFGGVLEGAARLIKLPPVDIRTKLEQAYVPPFAKKEADRLRIMVYGGSTVQGLPLAKVGMVNQLDFQIRHVLKEIRDVEVYNLGWSGYNSTVDRWLVKQTIREKPDLLVIYTGHNEFIYPQLDAYSLLRVMAFLKNHSALVKTLVSWQAAKQQNKVTYEQQYDLKRPAFRQQKLFYEIKMFLFRQNVKAMIKMAQKEGTKVILVTQAGNIADWPPVDKKVTTLKKPVPPNEDPKFLFEKKQFIQAKDWDYIPWRTRTDQNDWLRSLEDKETVWVADAEAELANNSKNGLIGKELIIDDVHPTKEGAYLIVRAIIEVLKKDKIVQPEWWLETDEMYTLDQLLQRVKYSAEDEWEIYYKTAKYTMKNPFFHFPIAEEYLQKAEKIRPDWRIKALRASMAFLQGNKQKGEELMSGLELTREQVEEIPYLNHFFPGE